MSYFLRTTRWTWISEITKAPSKSSGHDSRPWTRLSTRDPNPTWFLWRRYVDLQRWPLQRYNEGWKSVSWWNTRVRLYLIDIQSNANFDCMKIRFRYLTPRLQITPKDLIGTSFANPTCLHFICSPSRAAAILSEVRPIKGWDPITIYEPIPVSTSLE